MVRVEEPSQSTFSSEIFFISLLFCSSVDLSQGQRGRGQSTFTGCSRAESVVCSSVMQLELVDQVGTEAKRLSTRDWVDGVDTPMGSTGSRVWVLERGRLRFFSFLNASMM